MRKCIIKHCRKFVVALMLSALVLSTFAAAPKAMAATTDGIYAQDSIFAGIGDDETRYNVYLQQIQAAAAQNNVTLKDYSGNPIDLLPSEALATLYNKDKNAPDEKVTPELVSEMEKDNVIAWSAEKYTDIEWTFDVPEAGFYQISVEYISKAETLGINPARGMLINGEVPFFEARNMVFKKWWVDASGPKYNDITRDESAPDLVEKRHWAVADLRDTDGYYIEPFKVYFEKGTNTITLTYVARDMFLSKLILSAPDKYDNYATVSSAYKDYDKNGTEIVQSIQAEDVNHIVEKSSNMMRLTSSKDTSITPFDSGYTRINQIGGSANWYSDRDSYTWKFTVPEDGLYKIALRVNNNFNIGMPVYRQISIDGEIPFDELQAYKFKYDYNYYTEVLSDVNNNPYLFELKKGEHTIKLEVSLGELGELALLFYSESNNLNKLTRAVKKIIGDNPDMNFNYELEKRVENLEGTLQNLTVQFETMIETLQRECETDSSTLINELRTTIETLKYCAENPIDIPARLMDLTNVQTSMGSWIKVIESSALNMDYFEICQPAATPTNPKTSFWKGIVNVWDSFIVSFTKDYNAAYQQVVDGGGKVIEIWLSRDRENADMMLPLLNEEFRLDNPNEDHQFVCNVRIVPGQIDFGGFNLLLLSLMSGQEPDMIWGCGAGTPVQFAIRGIGYDLSQFEDYEEVAARFAEGTMHSLSYTDNTHERDGVFGLPETTDVSVWYYRTDVFEELGISVPNTWDEYYDVLLPTFYREGYIAPAADTGAWLLQRDGWISRSDNRLSGYDTQIAYDVQMEGFDLYLVHGLDLAVESFQSFRNGEYPLMGGGFSTYTQLLVAAPELMGKWSIALPCGTPETVVDPETGEEYTFINRTLSGGGASTALAIMPKSEYKNECWEVMKWWTSTEVQVKFTYMVDAKFGQENRHYSANMDAVLQMGWSLEEQEIFKEVFKWFCNSQAILGSYQMDRYGSFAFNQVVLQGRNARDAIEEMIEMINPEVERKQSQYDITPPTDEEKANKVYDITAYDKVSHLRDERNHFKKNENVG